MSKRRDSHESAGCQLRDAIEETIEALLPLYLDEEVDAPESIQTCNPNSERVIGAHTSLIDALLPGRITPGHIEPGDFSVVLMRRLSKALRDLRPEIERVVPLRWKGEAALREGCLEEVNAHLESIDIMVRLLKRLPNVRRQVIEDIRAAYNGDPAALTYAEVHLTYPGLLAVVSHRLAHELYNLAVPVIPRLMSEWAHSKTGVDIHPGAKIGQGFFIDHGTGVVIGETCTIGNEVKIYQGVTLGAKSFPKDANGNPIKHIKRHPTVEDHVIIYAGATILGGDTIIGRSSTIGGNVFLMESVPPNSFVNQKHAELAIKQKGD